MSFDHKPENEKEKARIEAAGGYVSMGRIKGELAVARSIGDYLYKGRVKLQYEEQLMTGIPDIEIHKRDGTEEFLVCACDGIWEVHSNEKVGEMIRQKQSEIPAGDD